MGNHGHCDLRHNGFDKTDTKPYTKDLSGLIAAQSSAYVDFFLCMNVVACNIIAVAR
jgi:hypothetical protein